LIIVTAEVHKFQDLVTSPYGVQRISTCMRCQHRFWFACMVVWKRRNVLSTGSDY
jgi:hypothetical protein